MADVSNTAPLQPLLCAQRVWGKRWQQRSGARPAPGGGEAVPGPDRAAPTLSAVPAWPRCPPPTPTHLGGHQPWGEGASMAAPARLQSQSAIERSPCGGCVGAIASPPLVRDPPQHDR